MIPQTKIEVSLDNFLEFKRGEVSNEEVIQWEVKDVKDAFVAGVRFAEAEMNISEEDRIHLKNTLALMNSMIKCGENHSEVSNEMLTKAFLILKPTHENES